MCERGEIQGYINKFQIIEVQTLQSQQLIIYKSEAERLEKIDAALAESNLILPFSWVKDLDKDSFWTLIKGENLALENQQFQWVENKRQDFLNKIIKAFTNNLLRSNLKLFYVVVFIKLLEYIQEVSIELDLRAQNKLISSLKIAIDPHSKFKNQFKEKKFSKKEICALNETSKNAILEKLPVKEKPLSLEEIYNFVMEQRHIEVLNYTSHINELLDFKKSKAFFEKFHGGNGGILHNEQLDKYFKEMRTKDIYLDNYFNFVSNVCFHFFNKKNRAANELYAAFPVIKDIFLNRKYNLSSTKLYQLILKSINTKHGGNTNFLFSILNQQESDFLSGKNLATVQPKEKEIFSQLMLQFVKKILNVNFKFSENNLKKTAILKWLAGETTNSIIGQDMYGKILIYIRDFFDRFLKLSRSLQKEIFQYLRAHATATIRAYPSYPIFMQLLNRKLTNKTTFHARLAELRTKLSPDEMKENETPARSQEEGPWMRFFKDVEGECDSPPINQLN